MANLDHLDLQKYLDSSLDKLKRNTSTKFARFPLTDRDKSSFYSKSIENIENLSQNYNKIKDKYSGVIDPNLIFQLELNNKVNYDVLASELDKMNIQVLNVSSDNVRYWVVFSSDSELTTFKEKLNRYSDIKYSVFNVVDSINDIPKEQKIGPNLLRYPLENEEIAFLNLELWRMNDSKINEFITQIEAKFNPSEQFRITDKFITRTFALCRIRTTVDILEEILSFKEVASVDRPYKHIFSPYQMRQIDIGEFDIEAPLESSTGILIIDSGVVSSHPLLEKTIGDQKNYQTFEDTLADTAGHGTPVGGCCVYYDIQTCIDNRNFTPSNFLFSAKLMYGREQIDGTFSAVYDDEKLVEHQLSDAIDYFLSNDVYRIKVVNLSLGNSEEILESEKTHQFPLAALLDELSVKYLGVVFVVCMGNASPTAIYSTLIEIKDNYPEYLINHSSFKLINPSTSALSISVGSICHNSVPFSHDDNIIWTAIAEENDPSPFSRTGLGINKMIKPEVVEYGGNLILNELAGRINENLGQKLTTLSNNPVDQLFKFDFGTSISTAKISYLLGNISNKFPNKSSNFIKNLLIASTSTLNSAVFSGNDSKDRENLLKCVGYGKPNLDLALFSDNNRVLLLAEDEIGLNKVMAYQIDLPDNFNNIDGLKSISVILTYNPLTNKNRGDSYFSNILEFRLYQESPIEDVLKKFSNIDFNSTEEISPIELKKFELSDLEPKVNARKTSCHQKASKTYKSKIINSPLSLVLISSNKWNNITDYTQKYCVSVIVEHRGEIDLYTQIRAKIQERIRVRG